MPWHTLNIAPTRDEREIRRAYAKLLKTRQHEDDPDYFNQLRWAYETALSMAQTEELNPNFSVEQAPITQEAPSNTLYRAEISFTYSPPVAVENSSETIIQPELSPFPNEDDLSLLTQKIEDYFTKPSEINVIDVWERIQHHPQMESLAVRETYSERLAIVLAGCGTSSAEIWLRACEFFNWQYPVPSDQSPFANALRKSFIEAENANKYKFQYQGHFILKRLKNNNDNNRTFSFFFWILFLIIASIGFPLLTQLTREFNQKRENILEIEINQKQESIDSPAKPVKIDNYDRTNEIIQFSFSGEKFEITKKDTEQIMSDLISILRYKANTVPRFPYTTRLINDLRNLSSTTLTAFPYFENEALFMWDWKLVESNNKLMLEKLFTVIQFRSDSKSVIICHRFTATLAFKDGNWHVVTIDYQSLPLSNPK